jgi:hypothetical protein
VDPASVPRDVAAKPAFDRHSNVAVILVIPARCRPSRPMCISRNAERRDVEHQPVTNWHYRSIASHYRSETPERSMVGVVNSVFQDAFSTAPPDTRGFPSRVRLKSPCRVKAGKINATRQGGGHLKRCGIVRTTGLRRTAVRAHSDRRFASAERTIITRKAARFRAIKEKALRHPGGLELIQVGQPVNHRFGLAIPIDPQHRVRSGRRVQFCGCPPLNFRTPTRAEIRASQFWPAADMLRYCDSPEIAWLASACERSRWIAS